MAFGFNKTRFSPIAIDFGSDSLKLLQIIPTDPPQLVAAASSTIPEHARNDANQRQAFLVEALRNLLATQPFKGKRAMLSIPAFQTLVQNLEITTIEHESFDAQVALHLQQRLNVDPTRMVVRNYPVTETRSDTGSKQEIICIAAPRESVMRYIDIAHRCKLDVIGMHGEPHALTRAFGHLYRSQDDRQPAQCYIDIGAATTKVVITHGTELVFAKTIHAAGEQMTRRLAKSRDIGLMEARERRIAEAMGLDAPCKTPAQAHIDESPAVIPTPHSATATLEREAVATAASSPQPDETLDCLIDELQMCLRYHQRVFPNQSIEKLIFLGGESMNKSTCQAVARAVRVAAQLGDPFARLTRIGRGNQPLGVDLDRPQPGWAVPMGLCLSDANL